MHTLDIFIQNYFVLARTSQVTEFFYLLTILFDQSVHFVLISFLVAVLIYIVRNIRFAFLFLFSIIFAGLSVYVLKYLFNIARPTSGVMEVLGQSFPSGHATVATVFFIMLMYVFDEFLPSFWRIVFNTVCIFGVILVAFSRVYLGVHWTTDVLAGVVLGGIVSYVSIFLFKRSKNMTSFTSMLK